VRNVRAGDESLGGNAARVHASAAEAVPLDKGDAPACCRGSRRKRRAGLAGADDDGIEMLLHGVPLSGPSPCAAVLREGQRPAQNALAGDRRQRGTLCARASRVARLPSAAPFRPHSMHEEALPAATDVVMPP
jgi:hypothetical protein